MVLIFFAQNTMTVKNTIWKKETHKLSLELKGNNKYYKKMYYTLSKTILNNLKQLCDDADSFCIAMHCLFSGNLKKNRSMYSSIYLWRA